MQHLSTGGEQSKGDLRTAMLARRAAIPAAERGRSARALGEIGLDWLPDAAGAIVSGFFSIGDELGTQRLLAALHSAGHPLCLPVMQARDKPLLFRAWAPGDAMATAVWGIQEPQALQPERHPAILLVPLLAVDVHGWRLGYGGGYYDRTLRQLRRDRRVLAVGLAFDEQVIDAVPHLDYDERVDWVLTPTGPRACQP